MSEGQEQQEQNEEPSLWDRAKATVAGLYNGAKDLIGEGKDVVGAENAGAAIRTGSTMQKMSSMSPIGQASTLAGGAAVADGVAANGGKLLPAVSLAFGAKGVYDSVTGMRDGTVDTGDGVNGVINGGAGVVSGGAGLLGAAGVAGAGATAAVSGAFGAGAGLGIAGQKEIAANQTAQGAIETIGLKNRDGTPTTGSDAAANLGTRAREAVTDATGSKVLGHIAGAGGLVAGTVGSAVASVPAGVVGIGKALGRGAGWLWNKVSNL